MVDVAKASGSGLKSDPGDGLVSSDEVKRPQVVIENPILNSPFEEPRHHFKFDRDGITTEIEETRRRSATFIPVPLPRRRGVQLAFDQWNQEQVEENEFINRIRERVKAWREGGYSGVSTLTRRLLEHWTDSDRERRLFFCQVEALETIIYVTEVAGRMYGDAWIENDLKAKNAESKLFRVGLKMATGSGKTAVMAMLIAWHTLNKLANPQDRRFSDAFLVVSPGITIRDRLRVLLPNDPDNAYEKLDLVPIDLRGDLGKAKIVVTNFHAFKRRDKAAVGKLTRAILDGGTDGVFTETPDEMVRRVCQGLGNKRNVVVINDEAHHCYRPKAADETEKLTSDEREEAKKRAEAARLWINGLEAVKAKSGVRVVYDLSATPFYLKGSGYREGTLFPWIVSDFSLIDAIEAGVVKIPRVPVDDNTMRGQLPSYRYIWPAARELLPRRGRANETVNPETGMPASLEGALHSLYSNYEKYHQAGGESVAGREGATPPVFIVVCSNTAVSKLVYDYLAGWEKTLPDGTKVLVPGKLPRFSNVDGEQWTARPNTILVDSEQLESGEGMGEEFKRVASREIEEFKSEYRRRFPGRDTTALTDEDLLREVLNTVGKADKLGEQVKCVVSVSMLTEGWDANTVTHILGIRAFGTQLLCEQVIGRGLRRMSYTPRADGMFDAEYAEVYGVPFTFIPTAGSTVNPAPPVVPTRVRALPERSEWEITYPRVIGYRYQAPTEKLDASFSPTSRLVLSTADVPTKVEMEDILGGTTIHRLDDLRKYREKEVAFGLAKRVLETYFRDGDGNLKFWLFPQVLRITQRWLLDWVVLKDDTFPQLLLLAELANDAIDKIYRAIVASTPGEKVLLPILRPYDPVGSSRWVDFQTVRPTYTTRLKCHVSHVVGDTTSWEQRMAQALEEMVEVVAYVKNQNLGFTIPYTLNGQQHNYVPDFLARVRAPNGEEINLIVEVSGAARRDKEAKVATTKTLWVPALNNLRAYGTWAYIEINDPWNAKGAIRSALGYSAESVTEGT